MYFKVIIVPCGVTASLSESDRKALNLKCDEYATTLKDAGMRAKVDARVNYSPGWKFNHWELKVSIV